MTIGNKLIVPSITITGKEKLFTLKEILLGRGKGLIVHGTSFSLKRQYPLLRESLAPCGQFYQYNGREPRLQDVRDLLVRVRESECNWIVGIGGGAIIDLAKAAAGLANAGKDPEFYMQGGVIEKKGISFIAVPTTAGSGAEASINSVIINEKTMEKLSIRDDLFLAQTVILDPELLIEAPAPIIAHSGLDAITQAIESYCSINSTCYTETMAIKGFDLLINNLETAYDRAQDNNEGTDRAFINILTGSYLTGVAFTNSRLGVVHGIAHPLGSYYGVPHGLVCALCLVPALEINKPYILEKYEILSQKCGMDLIEKVKQLMQKMNITNVFKGKEIINKDAIISYTLKSGSTAANPKKITPDDVECMLSGIFS
ncbi:MAG TPA: hypothetical protein DCS13_05245 [Candidatus Margulisbacteria bacterium]|nr:MAG: hypothetical protein A2X43_13090 [Candidatus Margulisbacteria bacterium GWD2_39_127]HAR62852.1 hypothetical protein [Candidatus Margulisiibacteriota bacterium]